MFTFFSVFFYLCIWAIVIMAALAVLFFIVVVIYTIVTSIRDKHNETKQNEEGNMTLNKEPMVARVFLYNTTREQNRKLISSLKPGDSLVAEAAHWYELPDKGSDYNPFDKIIDFDKVDTEIFYNRNKKKDYIKICSIDGFAIGQLHEKNAKKVAPRFNDIASVQVGNVHVGKRVALTVKILFE
ncbi:MAG: hypothetical protein NC301_07340 [Bacteroides sp.]|nr:hypothetical protein [Bacteroides sp.]MCM1380020.1 hypothetical protein [Bacteroides sp.]MCM1446300.1 hypothetical protein [Prevotella sp.]